MSRYLSDPALICRPSGFTTSFGFSRCPIHNSPGRSESQLTPYPLASNSNFTLYGCLDAINADFAELEARALSDFKRERFDDPPDLLRSIDFRYSGQNWELEVSVPNGEITPAVIAEARTRYDAEHDRQFGWSFAEVSFELVNFRVVALARHAELHLPDVPTGPLTDPMKSQKVHFTEAGGNLDTPFYLPSRLTAGSEIPGPAIIIEDDATTLVPPPWTARMESHGSIILGRN